MSYNKIALLVLAVSSCMLAGTIRAQSSATSNELVAAFTTGLASKWAAKRVGAYAATMADAIEKQRRCAMFDTPDECDDGESHEMHKLIFSLGGLNLAIWLWFNALYGLKDVLAIKDDISLRPEQLPLAHQTSTNHLFNALGNAIKTDKSLRTEQFMLAHQSGLDTNHLLDTVGDGFIAWQKLTAPDSKVAQDLIPLAASSVAGLAGCGAAFYAGERIATRITDDPMKMVMIIFTIGIIGSAIAKKAFFALGESMSTSLKECHACEEVYTVGEDLAYVFAGVIPGYAKFLGSITPKAHTAKVKSE